MLIVVVAYLAFGTALGAWEVNKQSSAPLTCRLSIIALMAVLAVPALIGELLFSEKH